MARKQDMSSGGGSTFSGNTKGSTGIGSIPGGVGGAAQTGKKKAFRSVGWPGVQDSRPEHSDRIQSAK